MEYHDEITVRADVQLSAEQWRTWRGLYLSGKSILCPTCKVLGEPVLRSLLRVFEHPCGHLSRCPENLLD